MTGEYSLIVTIHPAILNQSTNHGSTVSNHQIAHPSAQPNQSNPIFLCQSAQQTRYLVFGSYHAADIEFCVRTA